MSETDDPKGPSKPMKSGDISGGAGRSPNRKVPARIESHGRAVSRSLEDALRPFGRRSLAEEFASGLGGPSLKHLTGSSIAEAFKSTTRLSTFLEDSAISRLTRHKSPVEEALRSLGQQRSAFSGLGIAAEEARRLHDWAKPLGGLDLVRRQLGLDTSRLAGLGRSHRWADDLASHRLTEITSVLGRSLKASDEIQKLVDTATGIVGANDIPRQLASSRIGEMIARGGPLEQTALKMSLFAGALDVAGPRTAAGEAAFAALLGRWRTRPDLPSAFWRSREARIEIYRDADVDGGLVEADSATALEVLVESGVVEGETRRGSVAAVIEAGPVRMLITAGRTRLGAYRAIDAFEVALRSFVAVKLAAAVAAKQGDPAQWFKHRVPGDVMKRAKERRREALKNGDASIRDGRIVDKPCRRKNVRFVQCGRRSGHSLSGQLPSSWSPR